MKKYIVGIALPVFTSFCGYYLAKKYRRKKRFFFDMDAFNERYLGEIVYRKRPIAELVGEIAAGQKGDFIGVLSGFLNMRQEGMRFEMSYLNAEENDFLNEYLGQLGVSDSDSQNACFSAAAKRLEGYKAKSLDEEKRYGGLYVKLGFLFGLLLLILFI